jgi:hypothetical protein
MTSSPTPDIRNRTPNLENDVSKDTTTQEMLTAIAAKTGRIGWYFYFDPATRSVGEKLGLGAYEFYLLGRGGALGDVAASIVSSAFGFFNPDGIARDWNRIRTVVSPAVAAQAYFDECGKRGSERLGGVSGLAEYIHAADIVIEQANTAGIPLFAGHRQLTCTDDLAGRAMQKANMLRELRGGFHLCAVLAAGLTPVQAHTMQNPGRLKGFGWDEAAQLPPDSEARMLDAEKLTNQMLEPAFSTLTTQQRADLVAGTNAIDHALPPATPLNA